MFLKILKKDLKRKKTMNFIVFLFLVLACILMAGSSNMLYSTMSAVDYFEDKSQISDFIVVTKSGDEDTNEKITAWGKQDFVKVYQKNDVLIMESNKVTDATGKKLSDSMMLYLSVMPVCNNLVFDQDGKIFELKQGEVAIPVSIKNKLNLKVGDTLSIQAGKQPIKLKVSKIFKDFVYGSEFIDVKRMIVTEDCFNQLYEQSDLDSKYSVWEFTGQYGYQSSDLEKSFNKLPISAFTLLTPEYIRGVYVFDMMIAAVMIFASFFLFVIALLILRFTITFTIMEDYKEIGVMKAIGIKDHGIREIYTVKYLILCAASGVLGFGLSFPFAQLLKDNISRYIILKSSSTCILVSFISIVIILGIVVLFCNLCTRKIKKISAIQAIHQGNNGERFKNSNKVKLNRRNRMGVPCYLAVNDLFHGLKKFIVMILAFTLGTWLIIMISNVISTMKSPDTVTSFGYVKSDFYIDSSINGDGNTIKKELSTLNNEFDQKGFDIQFRADIQSNVSVSDEGQNNMKKINCYQGVGTRPEEYQYLEGTPPLLKNEIAITEKAADYFGVSIGDSVLCNMNGKYETFIITAYFQITVNYGYGIRFSNNFDGLKSDNNDLTVIISGLLNGKEAEKERQIKSAKYSFPDLDIKSSKEFVDTYLGQIVNQLNSLKGVILFMILMINFLITALLVRMLSAKEVPEIAVLKSLGFNNHSIKSWQIWRIGIILSTSIVMGILLALLTEDTVARKFFTFVGMTRIKLYIEPVQAYLFYPLLIFIVTMTAVIVSLGSIKRTRAWEINQQE